MALTKELKRFGGALEGAGSSLVSSLLGLEKSGKTGVGSVMDGISGALASPVATIAGKGARLPADAAGYAAGKGVKGFSRAVGVVGWFAKSFPWLTRILALTSIVAGVESYVEHRKAQQYPAEQSAGTSEIAAQTADIARQRRDTIKAIGPANPTRPNGYWSNVAGKKAVVQQPAPAIEAAASPPPSAQAALLAEAPPANNAART